ncbi:MAG: efflux transporter outer membrane subunit [Mariprofundaceae bacterium]
MLKRIAVLAMMLQAGCAATPAPSPDLPEMPAQWSASDAATSPVALSDRGWLADFDDERLESLVSEALSSNHDLAASAARLAAARQQARIAGAARLPEINLGLNAARSKRAPSGLSASSARAVTSYGLDATLSWEADVWGRIRAGSQAATKDFEAARADWRAARLSLAAEVARDWFTLVEAQAQERLALRTLTSFRQSLEVVEGRYRAGLATALDFRLARENAATAKANLAGRRLERDSAARVLEVLLGRFPSSAIEATPSPPRLNRAVPAGLPSDLLARRPDLVASEKRLAASGWRVAEARRARLPSLTLTATGGTASDSLRNLLDWDFLVWSIVSGLTQPLFTAGRLSAEQALAEARDREALELYAQTVLNALREVESSLAAESYLFEQERALANAAAEAGQASDLALERYGRGLSDMVTLLVAQRRAFDAESAHLRTARERLVNRVNLYLALGGDFTTPENDGEIDE